MTSRKWADGVQLLNLAVAKADIDQTYADELQNLFDKYSTIDAREVFGCFGDYWKSLKHQNAIDSIDSGFLHLWNLKHCESYEY